jgi:hypothetical protein
MVVASTKRLPLSFGIPALHNGVQGGAGSGWFLRHLADPHLGVVMDTQQVHTIRVQVQVPERVGQLQLMELFGLFRLPEQ